ncbi:MAG: UbiA prenyltransferase family protein, partial [Candidatus Thermoplasmatota archaeon]|nr:UbiA prenyltransferase family protein [Candidatus Thermoplasmatota archaeon]
FVFSISPLINAVSDYEGDKKAGVRNLYTIYGFEKGKKMVSILIVILFLTPLLIFHSLVEIIFLLVLSLISAFIFYRYEKYKVVLGLYFIVLIYILIRFLRIARI